MKTQSPTTAEMADDGEKVDPKLETVIKQQPGENFCC